MKNLRITVKNFTYLAFLGMCTVAITSCDNGMAGDTKEVADEKNEDTFAKITSKQDAEFLVEAAAIHLEEIQLGELAQQKGMRKDVKELGKMMEVEHRGALNDLKKLAQRKSVAIPASLTEDGQEKYDALNAKIGKDFDKKYCDMMVKGHTKAIATFEEVSSSKRDAEIADWATSMLETLNSHLAHSTACQESCEASK